MPEPLKSLRDAIVAADARSRGKRAPEPSFVPHVTLFRGNAITLPPVPVDPIRWRVKELCLIDSRIGARSEYDLIERWTLKNVE